MRKYVNPTVFTKNLTIHFGKTEPFFIDLRAYAHYNIVYGHMPGRKLTGGGGRKMPRAAKNRIIPLFPAFQLNPRHRLRIERIQQGRDYDADIITLSYF